MQSTYSQKWVSVKDAALLSGYNVEYLRQLVRAGTIAARRNAKRILVDKIEITQLRKKNGHAPARPAATRPDLLELYSGDAEAAAHATRYLTDPAERMRRNQAVIDHLDALSNVDAAGAAEQRASLKVIQRGIDESRASYRKRFPSTYK